MNTFVATLYRDFTCAVAAVAITLVMGMAFVQSTELPPGAHAADHGYVQADAHGWFGQPEPAVLVD